MKRKRLPIVTRRLLWCGSCLKTWAGSKDYRVDRTEKDYADGELVYITRWCYCLHCGEGQRVEWALAQGD